MTYERPYNQRVVANLNLPAVVDLIDVDQVRRLSHPEHHHGNETLSAGQDTAVLFVQVTQHADGFGDAARDVTLETGRLHREFLPWRLARYARVRVPASP